VLRDGQSLGESTCRKLRTATTMPYKTGLKGGRFSVGGSCRQEMVRPFALVHVETRIGKSEAPRIEKGRGQLRSAFTFRKKVGKTGGSAKP